jgi:hypothetical protein
LRDRSEWSEIGDKYFRLALEIHEYAALDAVHVDEEAGGYYDHEWPVRYADYLASNVGHLEIQKFYDSFTAEEALKKLHEARMKTAWLGGLPAYIFRGQHFHAFVPQEYGGVLNSVHGHYEHAASVQSAALLNEQILQWFLQLEYHKSRKPALYKIARRFADLKAKAATEPDGLLNYSKRMDAIQLRFKADFRDALARLKAVHVGMYALYNYTVKIPEESSGASYFEECLLWTRAAIQWIIRFTRRDQSCVFPVSVREVLGPERWNQFLAQREIRFELHQDLFQGMFFVRLRGLGAVVVEPVKSGKLWQFDVQVPHLGLVRRLDGSDANIDQTSVSNCRSNRVMNRDDRREPDIVGVSVLHNASPLGKWWQIKFLGTVPPSSSIVPPLDDIVLDLHVVFQTPAWPRMSP